MSDPFTDAPKVIRLQTGIPVTIKKVDKSEDRTKVVMIVCDDSGAELQANFNLSGEYVDFSKKQMDKVRTILGIASLTEAVGKKIGIQINRNEFVYKKGKNAGKPGIGYNISGYFPIQYLEEQHGNQKADDTDIPF